MRTALTSIFLALALIPFSQADDGTCIDYADLCIEGTFGDPSTVFNFFDGGTSGFQNGMNSGGINPQPTGPATPPSTQGGPFYNPNAWNYGGKPLPDPKQVFDSFSGLIPSGQVLPTLQEWTERLSSNAGSGTRGVRVQQEGNGAIALVPNAQKVPIAQGTNQTQPSQPIRGTEPINNNGAFSIVATDIYVPGFIPFRFTRYYRSDISYQGVLGFGWNFSYSQRLVFTNTSYNDGDSCNASHPDVFYATETMERIRFWYASTNNGIDHYTAGNSVHLQLSFNPRYSQMPWVMQNEDDHLTYLFDKAGVLVMIRSRTNHFLKIHWDHFEYASGRKLDRVVEVEPQSSSSFFFVYSKQTTKAPSEWTPSDFGASGDPRDPDRFSFVSLQCIARENNCNNPLLSFTYAPLVAVTQLQSFPFGEVEFLDGEVEFDLTSVTDADKHTTTYEYDRPAATALASADSPYYIREFNAYLPDALVEPVCHALCDSTGHSEDPSHPPGDCHNVDICAAVIESEPDTVCGGISNPYTLWLGGSKCVYACCAAQNRDFVDHEVPVAQKCNREVFGNDMKNTIENGSLYGTLCCGGELHPFDGWSGCSTNCQNPVPVCTYFERQCRANMPTVAVRFEAYPTCRQDCFASCTQSKKAPNGAYGLPPELFHNLTKITNADGRVVVENTYGKDPTTLAFDKVVSQRQGSGPQSTISLAYFDLSPSAKNHLDTQHVLAPATFGSIDICPQVNGEYAAPTRFQGTNPVQLPAYAVVITDFDGTARTIYYDTQWQPIREQSDSSVDRNFRDGLLIGTIDSAGIRTCIIPNQVGQPSQITQIPSPHYYAGKAKPRVVQLDYDDANELVDIILDPYGNSPSGTMYIRDDWERVVAMGQQVSAKSANWTCYSYDDSGVSDSATRPFSTASLVFDSELATHLGSAMPSQRTAQGRVLVGSEQSTVPTGTSERFRMVRPRDESVIMFPLSGCARALPAPRSGRFGSRDEIPSRIQRPDGSIVLQSQISESGIGDIVEDSLGADPVESYARFNDFGLVTDAGRIDRESGQPELGASRHSTIEKDGRLTQTAGEDPNTGQRVPSTFEYDNSHHLTQATFPTFVRTYSVDALGNIGSITDSEKLLYPRGDPRRIQRRTTCFSRDSHGRLLEVIFPEGNAQRYVYSGSGLLREVWKGFESSATDLSWAAHCSPVLRPQGSMQLVVRFFYDAGNQLKEIHRGGLGGFDTYITLDGFGRPIDIVTPLDSVLVQGRQFYTQARHQVRGYDSLGRISWEAVWGPTEVSYEKPTTLVPSLHSMVEFKYDLLDRVIEINKWCFTEDPLQECSGGRDQRTSIKFDDANRTITTVDPEGRVSVVQRDGLGRPALVSIAYGTPSQHTTQYQYARSGRQVTVTASPEPASGNQIVRTFLYNPHRALSTVSQDGAQIYSQTYDKLGWPDTQIRLGTVETQTRFDYLGRLSSKNQRVDSMTMLHTSYQTDRNDRVTEVTDPAGHKTAIQYDELDNVASIQNGIGTTSFAYLPGTQLVAWLEDPSKTHHQFTYNRAQQLESEDVVDGVSLGTGQAETVRQFTYNPAGRVRLGIVKLGCPVPLEADAISRRAGPAIASPPLCKNPDIVVSLAYDSLGRIIAERNSSVPMGITHRFLSLGMQTDFLEAGISVASVEYTHDELYRPLTVTLGNTVVAKFNYENGALKTIVHSNGISDTLSYDARGRMTGVDLVSGTGVLAGVHEALGFDNVPRLRQRTVAGEARTDLFKVDFERRTIAENLDLTGVSLRQGDVTNADVDGIWNSQNPWSTYTLDGAGNWLLRASDGTFFPAFDNIIVDDANRYAQINSPSGPVPVSYDGAGNLTKYQQVTLQFNGLGELLRATGVDTHTYSYDAFGRRFAETKNANETTYFLNDGLQVVALMPKGNIGNTRLRLGAGLDFSLAFADGFASQPTYTLHDGIDGSVMWVTDDQGKLVEGYEYSSQGETHVLDPQLQQMTSGSKLNNRFLFQGQLYDPDLESYAMGVREYQPALGRFISPDPIGVAGGLNLYSYAGGMSLIKWDPSGLSEKPQSYPGPNVIGRMVFNWQLNDYAQWEAQVKPALSNMSLPDLVTDDKVGFPVESSLYAESYVRAMVETGNQPKGLWSTELVMDPALNVPVQSALNGGLRGMDIAGTYTIKWADQVTETLAMEPVMSSAGEVVSKLIRTLRTPAMGALIGEETVGAVTAEDVALRIVADEGERAGVSISHWKADIGLQTMAGELAENGHNIVAKEISYVNLLNDVEGRADLISRWDELPDTHFIYNESKAGLNPRYTIAQAKNAPWMLNDFVPVRFFGQNAIDAGFKLDQVYYLKMEVYFTRF